MGAGSWGSSRLFAAADVSLKDGRFLVDGKPFFIVGVGYEAGSRPGSFPWSRRFEPAVWKRDLPAIRAARFNTLRTWSPLTDDELALVQAAGLKGPHGDMA